MALISELYFKMTGQEPESPEVLGRRMTDKVRRLEKLGTRFSDFGTRRRFSFSNQDLAVECCRKNAPCFFSGTSNVFLAMKYKCKAIGTQAHEWYMGIAAIFGYKQANRIGMEKWTDAYQGDLGIALTDTYTTDVFFAGFDMKFAKLFDGIRHDSGDPLVFTEKAVRHYEKLRIDPLGKTVVFSDSLNVDMIERIENFCKGRIRTSYGIGTNLTNDVGVKPLNMVIKLTAVKVDEIWVPTVKLSDDKGKHTGENDAVSLCQQVLGIKDGRC
jgi:nicotinate phosphoribosyltransferase